MKETIRVLIADDYATVREGLRALLLTEGGIQVVGEAADGMAALTQVQALCPDVVLLDLVMPRTDGLEVLRTIKNANTLVRVIVLTQYSDPDNVAAAQRAGADGFLSKDSSPQALLEAIRAVSRGERAGMLQKG